MLGSIRKLVDNVVNFGSLCLQSNNLSSEGGQERIDFYTSSIETKRSQIRGSESVIGCIPSTSATTSKNHRSNISK